MAFLILSASGRLLERIIVAGGGVLCLILGYRLFAAYAADVTKAEITGRGFTFKAERVGPGVFFALFGAVILIYSIISPVNFSSETTGRKNISSYDGPPQPGAAVKTNFAGAIDAQDVTDLAKIRLQSLVTYEQVAEMNAGDALSRLAAAKVGFQAVKVALIDSIYGKDRLLEWQKLVGMRNVQDAELAKQLAADPDLRRRFQEIEDSATKGF